MEKNYYPFGLNLAGLEKTGNPDYMFQYNQGTGGKTFQGLEGKSFKTERDKDFGLNWDMTKYRAYDYQLGRFNQVDPLAEVATQESLSPYQYSFNNPVRYNDPYGDCPLCGLVGAVIEYGTQVAGNVASDVMEGKSFTEAITDGDNFYDEVDIADVVVVGVTSTLTGGLGNVKKVVDVAKNIQGASKKLKAAKTVIEVGGEVVKASIDIKGDGSANVAGVNKDVTDVTADVIGSAVNVGINKSLDAEAAKATVDGIETLTDVASKTINATNDISKKVVTDGIKNDVKEEDLN